LTVPWPTRAQVDMAAPEILLYWFRCLDRPCQAGQEAIMELIFHRLCNDRDKDNPEGFACATPELSRRIQRVRF